MPIESLFRRGLSGALLLLLCWMAPVGADEIIAPLLDGMGDHHHPISSREPSTQRYFDQALVLTFNFNHVEAERPELAIESADRLRTLVPGAGHLLHMPSHVDIRVGRYHQGVTATIELAASRK